jgi:flagellar protein FlbD
VILVTRLNGTQYYINPDLIESIQKTPDTVITLINGKKVVVNETVDEVITRIITFKRKVLYVKDESSARNISCSNK